MVCFLRGFDCILEFGRCAIACFGLHSPKWLRKEAKGAAKRDGSWLRKK